MPQPNPRSSLHSPETTPSRGRDSPLGVIPNVDPIAFQWQRLASMDRHSPGFLPLLSSLTTADNRSSTTRLRGDDAKSTLGALDEIFRDGKVPTESERDTLNVMRSLAHESSQVPPRYQADPHSLTVEGTVIASGTFAEVRKGKLGGRAVAVRTLRIDQKTDLCDVRKRFCKESIIWMSVSHPRLLQLIAVDINPHGGRCSMISELMVNGNIREYICKKSANRHRLLEEAATGLCYLHKRGIVHGDLKGHNILINNETPPRACLADFGISTLVPGTPGDTTTITTGGTPLYMAPELLCPKKFGKSSARPTRPGDIYAFAMVIYEVLAGFQPFCEQNYAMYELTYHIICGVRPIKPDNAEQIGFGGGTWEVMEECWSQESGRRPKIEQVLSHLTRVAASSGVVGPTPERPRESTDDSPESGNSSDIRLFGSTTATALDRTATPVIPVNRIATINTVSSVSTISPTSTISTVGTLASRVPSSMTSVPSRNSEDSHHSVKRRFWARKEPSPTSPARRSPIRQSMLVTKLLVGPGDVLNSTIPMPIFYAKRMPQSDPLRLRGFIDKLKSNLAIGPPTPPL